MAVAATVRVRFPLMFMNATGGAKSAEVNGGTVGECLAALAVKYPALKQMLYEDVDKFYGYLTVSVNGKAVTGEFNETPVKAGDEIYPLILIEGG